jgi:hypothetical protein
MQTVQLNIDFSYNQLIELVNQLPTKDKLKLSEEMWSNISEIPLEHLSLLKERKRKIEANPESLIVFDDAIKMLKQ